jgi:hypothetical protein
VNETLERHFHNDTPQVSVISSNETKTNLTRISGAIPSVGQLLEIASNPTSYLKVVLRVHIHGSQKIGINPNH